MRRAFAAAAILSLAVNFPACAEGKASRLPDLPPELLKDLTESRAAQGQQVINLTLTTFHAPKISRATGTVAQALRSDAMSPRLLRELAILRTAEVVGSEYELVQHKILAKGCGYPQAKIDAVPVWVNSKLFDERERALLAYVDKMTHGGDVDDATFDAFAKFFTPQEIVELTVTVGNYYGNGLLTRALRVKLETDGRVTNQGKC